ncbi:alkylated DNA repair protein alkB [Vibrio ishigakensis]|uniref:Alkylated DNA repair protein alkB n=1 Tax=Vibrio ishigakensis TaxID=1481914 RepID=A0A0B8P8D2_9VIBR|nr:alkylated DNA repair protein alkB [Vibrio ishigakensis]
MSLGASRRFLLRHKSSGETLEYLLDHGDLFTMGGQLQEYWKHSLPKMRKVNMERINLTFRSVIG